MTKTYPTKFEVMQMIDNLKVNGCKIWSIFNECSSTYLYVPNQELYEMSIDDLISFLADKSLTYAVYTIAPWELNNEVCSLILTEPDDRTTNLDYDLIEYIANFILGYKKGEN